MRKVEIPDLGKPRKRMNQLKENFFSAQNMTGEVMRKVNFHTAIPLGILVVCSLLMLSGCANKAQTGAGVGALGGAVAGSLIGDSKHEERNALIGGLIGGAIGYAIGNEMDKQDTAKINNALETSPSYKRTAWVNPDTGNRYAVTPRPASEVNGRPCREAEIEAVIDGKTETVITTACRRPDGRWEM